MSHESKQIDETAGVPCTPSMTQIQSPPSNGEVPSDLRAMLLARWNALGEEVFSGHLTDERRLSDLGRDCELLATISTWFRTKGNITRAAERLHSSRRALRERIKIWRRAYPEYVPGRAEARDCGAKEDVTSHDADQGPEGAQLAQESTQGEAVPPARCP